MANYLLPITAQLVYLVIVCTHGTHNCGQFTTTQEKTKLQITHFYNPFLHRQQINWKMHKHQNENKGQNVERADSDTYYKQLHHGISSQLILPILSNIQNNQLILSQTLLYHSERSEACHEKQPIGLFYYRCNARHRALSRKTQRAARRRSALGPFLQRSENHEAFYVQSFLCQQVLPLSKYYTYAAFRI